MISWMFLGTYFALSDGGGIEFRPPEPLPPGDSGLAPLLRVLGAGAVLPSWSSASSSINASPRRDGAGSAPRSGAELKIRAGGSGPKGWGECALRAARRSDSPRL